MRWNCLEATMRSWSVGLLAVAPALLISGAGSPAETQRIPVMTVQQAESLPPSRRPTIFRDPDPYSYYPYNIHETNGLSRNPDDCVRWGCVDQNGK